MPTTSDSSFRVLAPQESLGELYDVDRRHASGRLYVASNVGLFDCRTHVVVVGSREAFEKESPRCRVLAARIAECAMIVVSRLRGGIDTVPRADAIERGGRSLAVLRTPVDECFCDRISHLALRLGRPLFLLESIVKERSRSRPEQLPRCAAQVLTRENLDEVLTNMRHGGGREAVPS